MIVAALVLIEVMLHVAAFFVGPRALAFSGPGPEEIVLCLGDSNTYGVFYPKAQTYPAQLQAALDRRAPGKYRTLNLGLPGMNSAQIATRLRGWIDQYQPRWVVVSVGINNYWNRADTGTGHAIHRLVDGIRLYRLIRLLLAESASVPADSGRPELQRVLFDEGAAGGEHRNADTGEVLITHEGNIWAWDRTHPQVSRELEADLSSMAELSLERGVKLVVMTYAAFPLPGRKLRFLKQQNVNNTIRQFSKTRGVALVDLHDRFLELLPPEQPRSLLFATEDESHANPVGYREVAMLVADAIHPGRTVVFSFADHLEAAVIERQDVPYEQVDRRRIRIHKDERSTLFQHPTTSVAFAEVSIGARASLEFAIALHPNAWDKAGDGVLFAVEVIDQEGQRLERYSRYINPKRIPDERRWIDERVDVSDLAGQRVSFVFRTFPGQKGDTHFDWSAWGEPRLVSEYGE